MVLGGFQTVKSPLQTVGVREFREHTADYLQGAGPIAVTHHGRVIGFYFPVPPDESETARALARLGAAVDRIRSETGITKDELSNWFNLRQPPPE
jgi:antitoxin (DNA-binding transcriptional repressor) of toxin-antitoxin stability system